MGLFRKKRTWAGLLVGLGLIVFILGGGLSRLAVIGRSTPHKVFVAVGFHGNLYHSYRIDTNDEAGFGKDIRIIRHIIDVLDDCNRKGVPVKGSWDIENLFSLEQTLPQYAPDIIKNLKRRVADNGDEVMLMSYNNALASALDREEFRNSVSRAISNPEKSGLKDLFGQYSPIVRPQEMMTTPGNFQLYRDLGIEAVSLYYSAITFDAIRLFVRPLTLTEAFNPLTYHNPDTGEKITVVPTYTIGDLVENVSLEAWAKRLHREQLRGRIDHDVLISVNFDADDPYWYGYKFPFYLKWLPNTGGLEALIEEVKDLDFIEFTTVQGYLANHPPVGEIFFGQDTADGNFNGYNSWSEKATSHPYWTAVMADRRAQLLARKTSLLTGQSEVPPALAEPMAQAYERRLRLLSTTNFGMASPFQARQRERSVEKLIREMRDYSDQTRARAVNLVTPLLAGGPAPEPPAEAANGLGAFLLLSGHDQLAIGSGAFLWFDLSGQKVSDNSGFLIADPNGSSFRPWVVDGKTGDDGSLQWVKLGLPYNRGLMEGLFHLYTTVAPEAGPDPGTVFADRSVLRNEHLEIAFSDRGTITRVSSDGETRLEAGSLLPAIHYVVGDKSDWYRPQNLQVVVDRDGRSGVAAVRLQGDLPMEAVPGAKPGRIDYRLTLISGLPYLFVEGTIHFPDTPRQDLRSPGHASLVRKYDGGWYEAAPTELLLSLEADRGRPFTVLKRNFLEIDSSYKIDYFRHHPDNLNLADVNNHITAEYAVVTGTNGGVAVAMDNQILSNFAFCPLKMTWHPETERFSLRMNPFGAYFGPQYTQPTWGQGHGAEAAILSGQQYFSCAPTYNGASQSFSLMAAFFKGDTLPSGLREDLINFAHQPLLITAAGLSEPRIGRPLPRDPGPPDGLVAATGQEGVYIHWEKAPSDPDAYHVRCRPEDGGETLEFTSHETTLLVDRLETGRTYRCTVTSVLPDGTETEPSREIAFTVGEPIPKSELKLPVSLQVKILWSGVRTLFN